MVPTVKTLRPSVRSTQLSSSSSVAIGVGRSYRMVSVPVKAPRPRHAFTAPRSSSMTIATTPPCTIPGGPTYAAGTAPDPRRRSPSNVNVRGGAIGLSGPITGLYGKNRPGSALANCSGPENDVRSAVWPGVPSTWWGASNAEASPMSAATRSSTSTGASAVRTAPISARVASTTPRSPRDARPAPARSLVGRPLLRSCRSLVRPRSGPIRSGTLSWADDPLGTAAGCCGYDLAPTRV